MRLKFLFFPIMLVISFSVFVGYIWPEITNVQKINEDMLEKNTEMLTIREKQVAIKQIEDKITNNTDGGKVVTDYLPTNQSEERAISEISYLAGAANVSLVNISLDKSQESVSTVGATSALASIITTTDSTQNQMRLASGLVQTTPIKISIVGDYGKITTFLASLQRMPLLSTLESVNITKQKSIAGEDEASLDPTALTVELSVNFGYMGVSKIGNSQIQNFKAGLDNKTIDLLTKYISQRSPAQLAENGNNVKGKTNPFASN